ncbi:hypothetical protein ATE62_04360 [Sphingopyxis sp. HIX]|nr:hypothetical protein ATE62_04360 [Sphingopyxis sp. HIX]KTE85221.1 hypothetical protein ATE72_05005 [Sphingopyxis sp. HXXIV]
MYGADHCRHDGIGKGDLPFNCQIKSGCLSTCFQDQHVASCEIGKVGMGQACESDPCCILDLVGRYGFGASNGVWQWSLRANSAPYDLHQQFRRSKEMYNGIADAIVEPHFEQIILLFGDQWAAGDM